MSCHAPVSLRRLTSIRDVDADTWNGLVRAAGHGGYPFIQHEYLRALEDSGSVGAGTGWAPEHIILEDDSGLVAAAPAYRKAHSYGEFVFDFAWAQAYRQCGLDYYPKLVCAIPFAPVEGPRLLARHEAGRAELAAALNDHIQPGPQEASSLHLLFADHADIRALETAGGLLRRDCQFQWFNRDYADFDTFLATLPARRRKEIRRERRKLHDAGVVVEHWHPRDIDEDLWDWLYAAYARNYRIRGQLPYLTPAFFRQLAVAMPDQVHYAIARLGIAPLTSMYTFGENDRSDHDDFRPEVHGSDGLMVIRADGEEPAFRDLLLPRHRHLHTGRPGAVRRRRAGRAQDPARLRTGGNLFRPPDP